MTRRTFRAGVFACAGMLTLIGPAAAQIDLPLVVTIEPGTIQCSASAGTPRFIFGQPGSTGTTVRHETQTGSFLTCSAENVGKGQVVVEGLILSPHTAGNEFEALIVAPGDVVTASSAHHGVGDGYGTNHGNGSFSAQESNVFLNVFNPNPYPVGLRVLSEGWSYTARGNYNAVPPYPSSAYCCGGSLTTGATASATTRIEVSPDSCHVYIVETQSDWPPTPGLDPELDVPVSGEPTVRDELLPGTSCGGAIVPANSSKMIGFTGINTGGFGDTATSANLIRSGYGLANVSIRVSVMLAQTSITGSSTLIITGRSPIDLMVTGPSGGRVGFDLATKRIVNDIPGATYSGHGTHPQEIVIPSPGNGAYSVLVQSIGDGPYTVDLQTVDGAGNEISRSTSTGTAAIGQSTNSEFTLDDRDVIDDGSTPADTTAPLIAARANGEIGNNGWYVSDVTLAWDVSDPESSVANARGCDSVVLEVDTRGRRLVCEAQNNAGLTNTETVTIKVDQTGPSIFGLAAAGSMLWPPDNRLVLVGTVRAADAVSGLASFTVTGTSNEPGQESDIVINGSGLASRAVYLRRDRLGKGSGRVYTISATATDQAGNTTQQSTTIMVPHDRGKPGR